MKFGIFFELEVNEGYTERDIWRNALDQIEFAEKMGFDSVYAVEHHFNPGYSHSPCPEILFAAASQRTKRCAWARRCSCSPSPTPSGWRSASPPWTS